MNYVEVFWFLFELGKLLLAGVGCYAILCFCITHLLSPIECFMSSIKSYLKCGAKESLAEKYGKWAVITGATDGIGKQFALQLANRGLNVCIISRSESKLKDTAKEIVSVYPTVAVRYIAFDFSHTDSARYDNLRNQLSELDVGILVNNVGRMYDFPNDFDQIPEESLWDIININIGAVTMMSRIVIPQMKVKRRGLIVNISSGTEAQPMPLAAVYGATKSYTKSFTLALRKELEDDNVKVQLVTPMFVGTNMISYSHMATKCNIFVPNAEQYVKSAVKKLDKCSKTNGYWAHGVQYTVMNLAPEFVRTIIAFRLNKRFRSEYHEQLRKKQFEV